MKATINHDKLASSLSYTSKVVSQKPNIPVLANVLVEAEKSGIKFSATNLDMGINMWIPCKVEVLGKTTVSARYLSDFVSASTSNNVDIELKENLFEVKTQKSNASFNTIPATEFPVLPQLTEKPIFKIQSSIFMDAMDKVVFACSTDLSAGKIQQSGVLFQIDKDAAKIDLIGLDSFRLSKKTVPVSEVGEIVKDEIIVPARFLSEVSRILQDLGNVDMIDVHLSESKSQIIFKFADIEFSIRLLEGPYPDYSRILPSEHSYSFEVKKSDLEEAIKIINTFARSNLGNKTNFDMDIERSVIKLASSVAEIGENHTEIPVEKAEGVSDLNTAYNLKYLQEVVNHIAGDIVLFESKGPLAASVFKDKSDKNFVHLIMPLRREA